jgi:hypothetical protein
MKRDREEFSKEETARRRDEVIRRMANTAPQHRASQPSKEATAAGANRKPRATTSGRRAKSSEKA